MSASLIACDGCQRHVRVTEGACPFCGAAITAREAPPANNHARLGRAATFAFGATLALAATGCSNAMYGGPPRTDGGHAMVDGGHATTDAGSDGGGGALYGGPPTDAGHDGGPVAAYGGPPP